jgi:hypothetical protein
MGKLKTRLCASGFLGMLLTSQAFAGIQKIAYITNDEDTDIINLELVTDNNEDITHLKIVYKHSNNQVYDSETYVAEKAADGVVLHEVDGRKVVTLESPNFSGHQGGLIKLDFLSNGITGARGLKKFDLSRNGDTWSLSDFTKKVKKLHFVSNKKALIGTIGIKRIDAY